MVDIPAAVAPPIAPPPPATPMGAERAEAFSASPSRGQGGAGPVLPGGDVDGATAADVLRQLRQFHLGVPAAASETEPLADDELPALLAGFRGQRRLRHDYPLFLYPASSRVARPAIPLADWLIETLPDLDADPASVPVLRDNIGALVDVVAGQLRESGTVPVDALSTLAAAGAALPATLELASDARAALAATMVKLLAALPAEGRLLGFGPNAPLNLLLHGIDHVLGRRRQDFLDEAKRLAGVLTSRLEVEWGKSLEAIEPKMVRESLGDAAAGFLDPLALSDVMDHARGSESLPPERLERLRGVLETLEAADEGDDAWQVTLLRPAATTGIDSVVAAWPGCRLVIADDPCTAALAAHDENAARLAELFRAVRIARLELDDLYEPALHDPWFAEFDWDAFSLDERCLVPPVVAVVDARWLAGAGLTSFSRSLGSGKRVHVMADVEPSGDPGVGEGERAYARTELGHLALSHRQVAVRQSAAVRPQHFLHSVISALDQAQPTLHLVGGCRSDVGGLDRWLIDSAAIEARAHPLYRYDPQPDTDCAVPLEVEDNAQPEADWPFYPFTYRTDSGDPTELTLAFTFADYALLEPGLRDQFRSVPDGIDAEVLTPVAVYLTLDAEEAAARLPYVWVAGKGGTGGAGRLGRAVATRRLLAACRDRRHFWHTLQALSGVRNRHLIRAVEEAEARVRSQADEERARLEAAHEAAVDKVRREAGSEAMRRLAETLLSTDPTALSSAATAPTRTPAVAETPDEMGGDQQEETSSEVTPATPAAIESQTPWVDTPLCTSCNECTDINPRLFQYDENKQAFIADAGAGTFAEIVEAAEVCPAACIHPGQPLNTAEADLELLLERAEPFNT